MVDISYSKYKPDDIEKHLAARKGNSHVRFDLFQNYVSFNENKKELVIKVDSHMGIRVPEDMGMTSEEVLAEMDEEDKKYYNSWGDFYINPHADTTLFVSLGQGMIDFCEAKFEEELNLILMLRTVLKAEHGTSEVQVFHPETIDDIMGISQDRYESLYTMFGEVFSSNLYISIFPPEIIGDFTKGVLHYQNYLKTLQKEFQGVLQFCFDVDYNPEELQGLNIAARYATYARINHSLPWYSIKQRFDFGVLLERIEVDALDLVEKEKARPLRNEKNDFEREWNLPVGWMDIMKGLPSKVVQKYSASTLQDILMFELKCMIDSEVKIKKCKNCGRYFLLKGNYKTEYCDRKVEGTVQTCQTIAAVSNYNQKVSVLPGWREYNKYYKRYYARRRVGTIKEKAFREWQYEALVKRDACAAGELTAEEFIRWLESCFPNRKKNAV